MRERSCGAVVFTRDYGGIRYVLVEQHSGRYSFPKGHMEPGETETETALREIREETGLRPVLLPGFRDSETYEPLKKPGTLKDVIYFLAEYSNQVFDPMETDAVAVRLFTFQEAANALPTESRRRILEHADFFLHHMIRAAVPEDLDALAAMEAECFPPAEAATREELAERLKYYGNHFLLMFDGDQPVSFIDGFVTDEPDLTDEMYENAAMHNENGRWQMIFGVNTLPAFRNRGYAGTLIRRMIADAREQGRAGLVLTCKDALVPYYAGFGFVNEGLSRSVHGGASWNRMRLTFGSTQENERLDHSEGNRES